MEAVAAGASASIVGLVIFAILVGSISGSVFWVRKNGLLIGAVVSIITLLALTAFIAGYSSAGVALWTVPSLLLAFLVSYTVANKLKMRMKLNSILCSVIALFIILVASATYVLLFRVNMFAPIVIAIVASIIILNSAMHIIRKTLTIILSVVLVASFWPGLLQSYSLAIVMLGVFLVGPSLAIALIIILALQWRRHHSLDFSELKVLRLVFVLIVVATLIMYDLPARVTVYLNKASITQACNSRNDASRVGIFPIRSSAITENGLFLVTLQHADGLGPDIVSHGIFCGQPGKDTPYGSARGGYRWVTDDIYYFFVSNDY